MFLNFDKPRAKVWKRIIVLFTALFCIGLGCILAMWLPAESLVQHLIKWALSLFLAGGGLWLLVIALQGDAQKIEKTFDKIINGIIIP